VDTNIVFSALLDTSSLIASLLLDERSPLDFCTVESLDAEIEKHKDRILRISKMSLDELAAEVKKGWWERNKHRIFSKKESAILEEELSKS